MALLAIYALTLRGAVAAVGEIGQAGVDGHTEAQLQVEVMTALQAGGAVAADAVQGTAIGGISTLITLEGSDGT